MRRILPIIGLILLAALGVGDARAETATLKFLFTQNGEPLEDPTLARFYLFEPGHRGKYVSWGHGDKPARVPEGVYDLVIRYQNGQVVREVVREEVELSGEMVREFDFQLQVARLTVQITAGGAPIEPHIGRYDLYPAGRRGKPAASGRPGVESVVPPGLYDIVATVIDARGLQTYQVENLDIEGTRYETVEIGEPPARLALTLLREGVPLSATQGRWRIFRPGMRQGHLVERGSGETADLEPGVYDIGVFYREGLKVTQRWLEGVHVAGMVSREVEVTVEPTRVRVEISWRGAPLPAAWFTVHPAGDHARTLLSGESGDTVSLPAGRYDVGCYLRDGGLRAETWLVDQEISGPVDLYAELDPRPATLQVRPPRRSRGRAAAETNVLLVLDSSLEMGEESGPRTRLEMATQTIDEVFGGSRDRDLRLGLRAWGIAPRAQRNCRDSSLLFSLGPVNRGRLSSTLELLRPTGLSPIAFSLERAAEDMPLESGNTLVLITGTIDTCGGDPCAEAARLLRRGAAARIHVVGLDLDREERMRLECVGQYHAAGSRREVRSALREILHEADALREGSVAVFEPGWNVWVAGGALGEEIVLSRGTYDILVRARGRTWHWEGVAVSGSFESVAGRQPSRR